MMEPDNPLLDDFILSLASRKPARICFLPTASADSAHSVVKFYRAFSGRAIPTDLTLFESAALSRRPARSSELANFVAEQDIIYVGGGNTANLLSIWRVHGLDRILHQAWRRGVILCGVSAGMICWFRDGLTDSYGGLAVLGAGLHNSGWVQSPGRAYLESPAKQDELKPYVTGLLTRFKDDSRVLAWDLFNEPDNPNRQAYGRDGAKIELAEQDKREIRDPAP